MIAEGYEKNHDLAQALWKENIRECKIMAAMLQPIDTFYPEIADIWVEDIQNIEIAELTCMNLFQHLPYAPAKSLHWIADEQEYVQTCGFLTAARLVIRKYMQHNEEHAFQVCRLVEGMADSEVEAEQILYNMVKEEAADL